MSRFAIRNPYFIIVLCLFVVVIGLTSLVRMPVDLFPTIDIPQVVVATFYNGMPPEDIETEITGRFERFFTLGAGIDHMESRSLPGASVIKIYFQPGTNADSDVDEISNLAMADLRRLPPGTLPPVVMKFDASSLPVCLITLKGQGLNETQLRDLGQFSVRNQIATAPGASVPPPFGGKYRQIMIYVDPLKLQSHGLSVMDVVRAVNNANLILPAGDAKIGPYDYDIYTNSQIQNVEDINFVPLKTVGQSSVMVGDIGKAVDAHGIQTNIVRVDGQRSVYLPILKQGGGTNTIAVVDGIRAVSSRLHDIPKQLIASVVFDQSSFVRAAVSAVLVTAAIGLFLTCLLVLVFLGSLRATVAIFLSVILSVLAAAIALYMGGRSINTMALAGLELGFSRLIYNAVVVLENIFRHLEIGELPEVAAEKGGQEVALPVLAATLAAGVVFFPVTFLYGVSRFLFSALALAVVLSLLASYIVTTTLVPLFCAKLTKGWRIPGGGEGQRRGQDATFTARGEQLSWASRFNFGFSHWFARMLDWYERLVRKALTRPVGVVCGIAAVFLLSLLIYPFLGVAFFPRTDAGQFAINIRTPSGARVEITNQEIEKVEAIVRQTVGPHDLAMIVSNIGVIPGFSSIYTSNSGPDTATVQVALAEHHHLGGYQYMDLVRKRLQTELPELSAFFQSGGLQDAVLNMGLPAPIDVQVSGSNLRTIYETALQLAGDIRKVPGVRDAYIPQDMSYPALRLNVNRIHAGELGLSQKEVVDNVITALTSNGMIAPSYWIDPKTGNDYMLTVQYPEDAVQNLVDLMQIPLRSPDHQDVTTLDAVGKISHIESPTEVDHYQIQRVTDVYVTPSSEDLGRVARAIRGILARTQLAPGVHVDLRGMVEAMQSSFHIFALGLLLAIALLYLTLVQPFRSFTSPFLILLAVPLGITGVLVTLGLTGATLNVMSLMGLVMLVGVTVSNSILIVDYSDRMRREGNPVHDAVIEGCRVRLRPILVTSLATLLGLAPMALKLGTGSETYAPLALAMIGGLTVSALSTLFLVPAAYLLVYRDKNRSTSEEPR
jgi:hydrophobic/amphiphilic exporter-1 (mainly G- bacteria), HAE1 family